MNKQQVLRRTAILVACLNLLLALVKTAAWLTTDSLALESESVNSWIDTVYSLVILIGVFLSTRDPNERFPEGHHRIEPFVSLIIGVAIIVTGVAVGYSAVQGILNPEHQLFQLGIGIATLGLSVVVKYAMYKYSKLKHEQTGSPLLEAIGRDNRNDVLTILVAFIGIIGYQIGVQVLDAVAALVVSLAIAYSGVEILRDNIRYILGESVSEEEKQKIIRTVMNNEEVQGLHDVSIHYSGPKVDVSMHLEVDGGMTIEEAHDIETTVGDQIRECSQNPINEINLHIDPKSLDEWKED